MAHGLTILLTWDTTYNARLNERVGRRHWSFLGRRLPLQRAAPAFTWLLLCLLTYRPQINNGYTHVITKLLWASVWVGPILHLTETNVLRDPQCHLPCGPAQLNSRLLIRAMQRKTALMKRSIFQYRDCFSSVHCPHDRHNGEESTLRKNCLCSNFWPNWGSLSVYVLVDC